jgi:hypothetical protein
MMHQQYIAGVIYETYLLTNVFISVTKIFLLYFWNPNKVNLNKIFVCVWPIWYDNIYMFLYIHCWLAGFNNISVISWQSVLSVEETRVPGENHPSITSHWQTLSHNVVLSTSPWTGFEPTTLVVIGTDCTGSCISNYHTITTVFTLLETETDRKMNLWWTFLACFPVTANKFYIYWHCTYIVFILQCQKLQNNYHIVWKEQY